MRKRVTAEPWYPIPPDEPYPNLEERGVCVNCGADMDFQPMHPWCPDCDFEEEDDGA